MEILDLNDEDLNLFFNSKIRFEENEVGIHWNIKTEIDEYILHFDLYILPNHVTISLFKDKMILFSISKENIKTLKFLHEVMKIEFINNKIIEMSLNPLKIKADL
jgi:hypothetical protein